ncbi:MAG: hypothetical protein IME93_01050 [Proteobacteria bacterium]|nr:hypothetical protein [Pseudomonadota bacterium]
MSIGLILGILLALTSGIWLLVIAFKEDIWWGSGLLAAVCTSSAITVFASSTTWLVITFNLITGLAAIVFVILNFRRAWLALALSIVAVFIVTSSVLSSLPNKDGLNAIAQAQKELQQKVERGDITRKQAEAETMHMLETIMRGEKYTPGQTKIAEAAPQVEKSVTATAPLTPETTEDLVEKANESHRKAREQWNEQWKNRYKDKRQQKELGYKTIKLANAKQHLENNVRITTRSGQVREGTLLSVLSNKLVVGKQTPRGVFSYDIDRKQISKVEVETWITIPTPK